ncbi:MAG: DUF2497 domain-containing protein [Pseudomonadota bacterium]
MAGPNEQSADAGLDDILSSIRKIVAEDLDGAARLKARFDEVQTSRQAERASDATGAAPPGVSTRNGQPQDLGRATPHGPAASPASAGIAGQVRQPATDAQASEGAPGAFGAHMDHSGHGANGHAPAMPHHALPPDSAQLPQGSQAPYTSPAAALQNTDHTAPPPRDVIAARPAEATTTPPAAVRHAAGTVADAYVADTRARDPMDPPVTPPLPRDALAPFDRSSPNAPPALSSAPPMNGHTTPDLDAAAETMAAAAADDAAVLLGEPIVLPTEAEVPAAGGYEAPDAPATAADAHPANGHAHFDEPNHEAPGASGDPTLADGMPVADDPAVQADDDIISAPSASPPLSPKPPIAEAPVAHMAMNGSEQPSPEPSVQATTSAPELAPTSVASSPASPPTAGAELEATVARLLRPMLKEWLDQNMPRLIEQALRDELGGTP